MKRNLNRDIITIFSTFGVVYLHANNYSGSFENTTSWMISYLFNIIFMCSVPLFFMVTGANLLSFRSRQTSKKYLRNRVPMLFFYLAWNLIYYLLYILLGRFDTLSISYFLMRVCSDSFLDLFWFMKPLFEIYFAIYFVSYLDNKQKNLMFLSVLIFVNAFLVPTINNRFGLNLITFDMFSGYFIYSLLGHLIEKSMVKRDQFLVCVGVLIFTLVYAYSSAILMVLGYVSSKYVPLGGYLSIVTLILSVCLYVIITYLTSGKDIHFLCKKSFEGLIGINIGFFAVQDFYMNFLKLYSNKATGYKMLYMPSVLWLCCYLSSLLISKISFLKINKILLAKKIR